MRFFKFMKMFFTRKHGVKASKRQDFYNAAHLFDQTQCFPDATWINLHGYRTEDGMYYIGADYRWLGIRIQNVVVNCGREQSNYNEWIGYGVSKSGFFHELVTDNLPHTMADTDTCFVFHTTDGKDKDYNVDQWGDVYAWIN